MLGIQHRTVQVDTGTLIADAASAAGIDFQLPCGGQGRCGRCTVVVREGDVQSPPNQRIVLDRGQARRARQNAMRWPASPPSTATQSSGFLRPRQSIERKLQTDKTARQALAVEPPFTYDTFRDQPLRKVVVTVTEPSLDDQTDDWSRLKRELARQHGIQELTVELPVLRKLSSALRQGDWTVTLVIETDRWDAPDGPPRLIDILPGDHLEIAVGSGHRHRHHQQRRLAGRSAQRPGHGPGSRL